MGVLTISNRQLADPRWHALDAVSRVLARAASLDEAAPGILQTLCRQAGWDAGVIWEVDPEQEGLRCVGAWPSESTIDAAPGTSTPRPVAAAEPVLATRVWANGQAAWAQELARDPGAHAPGPASGSDLKPAFASPVRFGGRMLAVIECYSRNPREPEEAVSRIMDAIGHQVGQFIHHRRVEGELQESEARKTAMLDAALDGVVLIDREGRVIEWNPAAERIFGYPRDQALGRDLADLILPVPAGASTPEALASGAFAVGHRVEMTGKRADGNRFPMELAMARTLVNGPPVFTAYIRDITERKRVEDGLRASEEEFRTIFELAGSGKSQTDPVTGRFLRVNRKLCEITGYTPEELLNLTFAEITHALDRPNDVEQFQRLVRGELREYSVEKRYVRKDGSSTWVHATTAVLRDAAGRPLRTVGVIQDINARKQAEQALRRSAATFHQLADAMPQIVWAARPDGVVDYGNRRWYDFTGFAEGETDWVSVLHRDDRSRCVEGWAQALRAGTAYETRCRLRDSGTGGFRWFLARAVPVRDDHGSIHRWYGTFTDIDAWKGAEERSARLNETLISVLAAIPDIVFVTDANGRIEFRNSAAEDFVRAVAMDDPLPAPIQSELEQVLHTGDDHLPTSFKRVHRFEVHHEERFYLSRIVGIRSAGDLLFGAVVMLQDVTEFRLLDEVKTNLISTVSHELKTPITSLRTALLLLCGETLGRFNPRQAEMLNIAREESERLLRTLNTLLDLAAFEENSLGMRLEGATPEELIQAAVEDTRLAAADKQVIVRLELVEGLPAIQVDRERIIHVLSNLLTNAIKHSQPGGEVLVRARAYDGPSVLFSVVDQGPGVPKQYHSRIFEKFFRVPGSPKKGAGLGLSIAREFIRAHRGRIGVHSELGRGSEFYFVLPLSRP